MGITALTGTIVGYMILAGKSIILIVGIAEVIKQVTKGDVQGSFKTVMYYGMAYGSIYLLKWGLNAIDGAFK